jgi:hypothetical protein
MDNGRCRIHGGLTPKGVASPHYVHGRRSRYQAAIKGDLAKAYKNGLASGDDLLSLKDETALLEARIFELLKSLNTETAIPYGRIVDALWSYEKVRFHRDLEKVDRAFHRLANLIRTGAEAAKSKDETWDQIMDAMHLKVKTSQTELNREVQLETLIPGEKALLIFNAILSITKDTLLDRLDDEGQAKRIMAEIAQGVYKMLPTRQTVIDNNPTEQESEDA